MWNLLVCIMVCIGIYYFCYVLHILAGIGSNGKYSQGKCASIDMVCIVGICLYLYVFVCFDR